MATRPRSPAHPMVGKPRPAQEAEPMTRAVHLGDSADEITKKHQGECATRWNGVQALLAGVTKLISHSPIPELRVLLESIASADLTNIAEVPLYCATPNATVAGRPFPAELRPEQLTGPA